MTSTAPIVTRFAPSPTGYLHVGGARTALFCWLLARHAGGTFLLRIEDTDLARSTPEATRQLVDDLKWLGLQWDNEQLVFQSKRVAVYDTIIEKLIADGKAYRAYETSEELTAARQAAEKQKRSFIYRRPTLTAEQQSQYENERRPHVVRFAMPVRDYHFDDAALGPNQGVAANQVQDFVIRKSDGMPTYHFAVVVDDAEMKVTHVLRGQEHLLNTVNHIALQEALGYPRPIYAHLPVILSADKGEKLSKRDRDGKIRQRAHEWMRSTRKTPADVSAASGLALDRLDDWLKNDKKQLDLSEQPPVMRVIGLKETDLPEIMVHDFRKNGYLPETLNNFLALLGWNPGGDKERMSMDELTKLFTLENVGKSNARFNREKLVSFNKDACQDYQSSAPQRLVRAFRDYLAANPDSPVNAADDATLLKLLQMKAGFRLLREVDEQARFLFVAEDRIAYDPAVVEKVLLKNGGEGLALLTALRDVLAGVKPWDATVIEAAVNAFVAEKNVKLNAVAQPLRVALTGTTVSPPIFHSLEMLGRERTLRRLERCVVELSAGRAK